MERLCDNTSVGVIITNEKDELLLLERAKFPFGLAAPAGHIDEHGSSEQAAITEVYEEVGLKISYSALELIISNRKIEHKCRRKGGNHHIWDVYTAKVIGTEITPSEDETRGARWYSKIALKEIIENTRANNQEIKPGQKLLEGVWLDFIMYAQSGKTDKPDYRGSAYHAWQDLSMNLGES